MIVGVTDAKRIRTNQEGADNSISGNAVENPTVNVGSIVDKK
jgi:hypothetical protein